MDELLTAYFERQKVVQETLEGHNWPAEHMKNVRINQLMSEVAKIWDHLDNLKPTAAGEPKTPNDTGSTSEGTCGGNVKTEPEPRICPECGHLGEFSRHGWQS